MLYLWAGLLAALGAWFLNRFAVKHFGDAAIIWLIPWLEELLKTGTAYFSGADLVLTHGVFGLVEAVHDYAVSARWGLLAGLLGIVSHWFYGGFTGASFRLTSSWVISIFLTGLLHVFWNLAMVRFFSHLAASRYRKGK
ncbi:MAG: hypothetical protein ACOX2X_01030 [Peptococcia bacterium]|jgi:hypothetical protein